MNPNDKIARASYPIPAFEDEALRVPTLVHSTECGSLKESPKTRSRGRRCSCHTGTNLVSGDVEVLETARASAKVRMLPEEGETETNPVWVERRGLIRLEVRDIEKRLSRAKKRIRLHSEDWRTFERLGPWIDKGRLLEPRRRPRPGHLVALVADLKRGELLPRRWLCEIRRSTRKSTAVLVDPVLRPEQALKCTFLQRSVQEFDPQRPERTLVSVYPLPLLEDGKSRIVHGEIGADGLVVEPEWC